MNIRVLRQPCRSKLTCFTCLYNDLLGFLVTYNIPNDNEDPNRRTNEGAELMEHGNNMPLQQPPCTTNQSADPSANRPLQGNSSNQISISSPYIHLSTCYAGKVLYLNRYRIKSFNMLILFSKQINGPQRHCIVLGSKRYSTSRSS